MPRLLTPMGDAVRVEMAGDRWRLRAEDELTLDAALGRVIEACGHDRVRIGPPSVRYVETVGSEVSAGYTHTHRQTAEMATARVTLQPADPLGPMDLRLPLGLSAGQEAAIATGVASAGATTDLDIPAISAGALVHIDELSGTGLALEIATRMAIRRAMSMDRRYLEPIMRVHVVLNRQYSENVARDMASRRGREIAISDDGERPAVSALIPLCLLFGYHASLRSLTDGTATGFSMTYDHYAPIPMGGGPDDPEPAAMARHP